MEAHTYTRGHAKHCDGHYLHGTQHADVHHCVQHIHPCHPELEDDVGVAVGLLQDAHWLVPPRSGRDDEQRGEVHGAVCISEHQQVLEGEGGGQPIEHKRQKQHNWEHHPGEHHRPGRHLRVLRADIRLHGLFHGVLVFIEHLASGIEVLGVMLDARRHVLIELFGKSVICGVEMVPELLAEMLPHVSERLFEPEFRSAVRGSNLAMGKAVHLLQHAGSDIVGSTCAQREKQQAC
mmetsp:Transcript_12810/g.21752  ORF Transcript_12810/g.21752 Transcript_12810/m.21752 type:complete len:235 (+) Transcript_12810:260-964(+)